MSRHGYRSRGTEQGWAVIIVLVCGALLVGGLVVGTSGSGLAFTSPPTDVDLTPGELAGRFVWYLSLVLLGGIAAGVTVIGAGGRLAMRLLAATAGDDAQGRITEADEVVGEITADGTIGFVVFNGVFGGVVLGVLWLVLRRFLPPGRVGGLAFGLGLLVVLGTTVDPLRSENPDFDVVGPGWLAVVVFTAMALAFGLTMQGMVHRLSRWLPLPSRDRRVLVHYLPVLLLAVVGFSVTAVAVVVFLVVLGVTRWRGSADLVRSPRFVLAGRVLLGTAVAIGLPNAVSNIADIAGRTAGGSG